MSPFGHPTCIGWPNGDKLVSTCVQIWAQPKSMREGGHTKCKSKICIDLHQPANPFGQGFILFEVCIKAIDDQDSCKTRSLLGRQWEILMRHRNIERTPGKLRVGAWVLTCWKSNIPISPQATQAVGVWGWVFDVIRVWVGINASYGKGRKIQEFAK